MNTDDVAELARACFRAYEKGNRRALEALLADDFRFSSPLDERIDRATYFRRCWPFHSKVRSFRIERLLAKGDEAFVQYLCQPRSGAAFRNTELFRAEDGRLAEVTVYFGSTVRTSKTAKPSTGSRHGRSAARAKSAQGAKRAKAGKGAKRAKAGKSAKNRKRARRSKAR